MDAAGLDSYLAECRQLTLAEIERLVPQDDRLRPILYDLMLEYPRRHAKALRPALCIATCRALGGHLEAVLQSAAVLELYHNAFLIHDDVEDGSELRRDQHTLHRTHGMPIAVNVGDAMLALALQPLLDNMQLIGMGKALRILQAIARMARESAEGQALELHWIRENRWSLTDTDYLRMVCKKTSWYSFITPMLIGGIVAGASAPRLVELRKLGALLGIAFQIQDDILNVTVEGGGYGKEAAGDLWEGKHTLILLHALRAAAPAERTVAVAVLSKPRLAAPRGTAWPSAQVLDSLQANGDLSAAGREALTNAGHAEPAGKTLADVVELRALIDRSRSIDSARRVAQTFARQAEHRLARMEWLLPSMHREFIAGLIDFVIDRNH